MSRRETDIPPEGILAEIEQVLVSEGSPEHTLEKVGDGLRQLVPHDTLTIYTADVTRRLLRPTLVRDQYAEELLAMGTIAFGTGITGTVAETAEPALVQDVMADPRSQHIPGTPDEPEALIAIPLVARAELKGVLCLYRLGAGNVFTQDEFRLAIRFGNLAALAIDNADIRARLQTQVVTDHLTGLHNHRFFHERLAEEVARAMRLHSSVALLVFDIDDFKWINDGYGHLIGDQVLQELASSCRAVCRAEDPVCRIGGEEFAILLPGQTVPQAAVLADRLLDAARALRLPFDIRITISIGLAEAPRQATGPRHLFAGADAALLAAKAAGKDRVVVFGSEEFAHATEWREQPWRPGAHRPPGAPAWRPLKGELPDLNLSELSSLAQMRMLHKLASRLTRLNDEAAIGEVITAELRGLIDYHNCRVYVLDEASQMLVPVAFRGELSEYEGETFDALLTRVGEGATGMAVERRETIYVPDAAHCEFAVQIEGTPEIDETILAVPLLYAERATGVIVLSRLGLDQFDENERRLLEVLAFNAATAFENARLIKGERDAARTLEEAYLSTVEALANALEAKDTHTHDHARALAEMAIAVGRELGLEGEPLRTLELAALFHDIGKIGVASEIIRKPGALTPEEWVEMKRHPGIGAQIIAPVPFLQPLVPIVQACHEHWDGNGYPEGLSGTDIPVEARIILVCDAFHAMTSDRPYRRALPVSEAIRRLQESAGTQFDPMVVDAFVRLDRAGRIETGHRDLSA
ncbi:MAG: diguanylate cyclase [Actinomycetota bacterium]|nr:diguanylate cyclase [Actinomycetota bacterium]